VTLVNPINNYAYYVYFVAVQSSYSNILELDKSINRLVFGLIISATLITSSFLLKINKFFGLFGFAIATILSIWLLYGIFRSGKL